MVENQQHILSWNSSTFPLMKFQSLWEILKGDHRVQKQVVSPFHSNGWNINLVIYQVGHAISLGGLMRVSVETAPGESIYATIWASPYIPCHMGKGETAQELFDKHIGEKLQVCDQVPVLDLACFYASEFL